MLGAFGPGPVSVITPVFFFYTSSAVNANDQIREPIRKWLNGSQSAELESAFSPPREESTPNLKAAVTRIATTSSARDSGTTNARANKAEANANHPRAPPPSRSRLSLLSFIGLSGSMPVGSRESEGGDSGKSDT